MNDAPQPRADADRAQGRRALPVVYLTVFLDLLGFGILLPALPYWTRDLGGGGLGLGLVLSSYAVAQFFGSPVLGSISDRVGRRPVLVTCLIGSVVSLTAVAFAPTLLLLCTARVFAGFFGGTIVTAQAYISDVTEHEERTRFLGLLGASIGLGFVLGPAIGAGLVTAGFGFRGTALAAAVLALLNLVWALFRLPEPPRQRVAHRLGRFAQLRKAWRSPLLGPMLVANLLMTSAFVTLETTFAFFGADRFGLDAAGFGMVMFGIGAVLVAIQGGAIGRLSGRFGDLPLTLWGGLSMAAAMFLLAGASTLAACVVPLLVLAVGRGLVSPTLSSMVSKSAALDEQGAALGAYQSMASAARAVVPLAAGLLYDFAQVAPFILGGALAFAAVLLILPLRGRVPVGGETLEGAG